MGLRDKRKSFNLRIIFILKNLSEFCLSKKFSTKITYFFLEETFNNISNVIYSINCLTNISQQAKDFIARLFVRDIRKRATVGECLKHPWITKVQ